MNLTYFLIIIFFLLNSILCYQKRTLEDDSFCSLLDIKRKVSLSGDGNEGLIVTHNNRLNEHSLDWMYDHACKFQVKMGTLLSNLQKPNGFGLVVVVQKLLLRQNKSTGECIDWIQFKTKHYTSDRYCGDIAIDNDGNMIHVTDKHGKIDTSIFISRKRLEPNEKFDLLLVYTPVKLCTDIYYPYFVCGNDSSTAAGLCMRNDFKNDSVINCPNCFDESDNCRLRTKHSSGVGTIATIGAILSLIISFVFFLSCVWICKRFNLFCWSHTFAAENGRSNQQSNVEMNLQENTIATPNNITTPSAPPLSADKDLPPPYESLFPDRAGDR